GRQPILVRLYDERVTRGAAVAGEVEPDGVLAAARHLDGPDRAVLLAAPVAEVLVLRLQYQRGSDHLAVRRRQQERAVRCGPDHFRPAAREDLRLNRRASRS